MKTAVLHRLWKEPVQLSESRRPCSSPLGEAVETARPDAIIRDPIALEISRTSITTSPVRGAWMTQTESPSARRSSMRQRRTLSAQTQAAVINLGAGLSTRFSRLDNGSIRWYEVDLPEVIALRKLFFRETKRYRCIAGSVTEPSTLEPVIAGRQPVLIVAEGLFMYFDEKDVRSVFDGLSMRFPKARCSWRCSPLCPGMGKYDPCLSKVAGGSLDFRWT